MQMRSIGPLAATFARASAAIAVAMTGTIAWSSSHRERGRRQRLNQRGQGRVCHVVGEVGTVVLRLRGVELVLVIETEQVAALVQKTQSFAAKGEFELFKSSQRFDSTAEHPDRLEGPSQSVQKLVPRG